MNGHFGKWHVGEDPLTQGFDVNRGGSARGNPGKGGYFAPYHVDDLPGGPEGEYLTDRLTSEAIHFMEAHRDTHFFVYLPYYTVHTPLMGPPGLVEAYRPIPPIEGQGHQKDYAAMVTRMDANVGRILKTLERLDLQNTLVIFSSDNGGIAYVSRQWPLRGGKGSYYEGGLRVPMLFYWPEKIQPGTEQHCPITFLDLYPTLLHLLDIPFPQDVTLDGTDLSAVVTGQVYDPRLNDRPLIWHFPIYLQAYRAGLDDSRDAQFRTRPGSIIRQGDWKLHHYFEHNELELYHLSQDPGERINLAQSEPQIAAQLFEELEAWRQRYHAPIPQTPNPDYQASE